MSPSAAGDFLVGPFENRYADGSSVVAAGILRYGSNGKVTEIRSSLEPLDLRREDVRRMRASDGVTSGVAHRPESACGDDLEGGQDLLQVRAAG